MKNFADIIVALAVIAAFISIVGAGGYDLWLASTQWLLICIALTAFAIYLRLRGK